MQSFTDKQIRSIKGALRVRSFQTKLLGRNVIDRLDTVIQWISKSPLNRTALSALTIMLLWKELHDIPDSPLFADKYEVDALKRDIERYPHIFSTGYLDRYYDEFVTEHEDPKKKWWVTDIIRETYSGEILHQWPITIGKVQLNGVKYLFIWHDKNFNQWRARTADHEAVNAILKPEKQGEYEKIVFFVDTPGADSGKDANDSQQAWVMSELITRVSTIDKPTLTILAWEGGSGGAEVFFGTDMRIATKNAYFGTIHPIGHSAIMKGKYSPKEIAWLLSLDAPHLFKKWVIDAITKLSFKKDVSIKDSLTSVIESSFATIEKKLEWVQQIPENERRLFLRALKSRQKVSTMLSDKTDEIKRKVELILSSKKYEDDGVRHNFDTAISKEWSKEELLKNILAFFMKEFENTMLTKFNILRAIDTLITHVGSSTYASWIPVDKRNDVVWTIREELYHYQNFFWTLSVLIDPKNYDKFFSTSGTHADRLISWSGEWLNYEKDQVEKFLKTIYWSSDPKHVHQSYDTWKIEHFSWLESLLKDDIENAIELTKKFKQVHYDMPETITSLTLLLLEKFISSIFEEEYDSGLMSSDRLPIDFHAKHGYELIRYYEALRGQLFGRKWPDEIVRKFFYSHNFLYPEYERHHTTALQDPASLEKSRRSGARVGWWRIGYDRELLDGTTERHDLQDVRFGFIMLDFTVEGGAIDGAASANIIRLIEEAARDKHPIIMFLQSAGMYVNGWPEAVASMSAINLAIAEYFRKTDWEKQCQIFSIPFWICTGWTIASFAQAPGVHVIPLSLTDMPFAGRIVTLDQLPLESTLADFQVGKLTINEVIENPFISESASKQLYEELRQRWLDVSPPQNHLIPVLRKYLSLGDETRETRNEEEQRPALRSNAELFHQYKKVAVLNRWVIATKAIRALEKLSINYVAFTTAADKNLPYIERASENNWKVAFLNDYMLSERGIVQAIKDSGCDAVYLGYWFWSERDSFIRLCENAGIVVIWPNSDNVERMWDKIQARQTFKKVLEEIEPSESERTKYAPARGSDDELGGDGILPDLGTALQVANKIGYPVMIKAVYGGGGKWIRRIESDTDLERDFSIMSREATESFGNGAMYMEKALDNQRHVEVQIFADSRWNTVSLGVRDCTTQRNRQKIIEETGDLGIDRDRLARLQDIAVAVAKNIGYVWAGTFEFLYDPEKEIFTFMEMNTRIQVEHTITERLIQDLHDGDINLVEMQFQVASGKTHKILEPKNNQKLTEKLKASNDHVMEVRICAEDPARGFAWVSMGKITDWSLRLPKELRKKVRFETYLSRDEGINHTSKYDSMFGQLIVSGTSREDARKNMIDALGALQIEWIPTNKEFVLRILKSPRFRDRDIRISTMDEKPAEFFQDLRPYRDKIESVTELREDSVVFHEGEYIVRMNQDIKLMLPPVWGTIIDTAARDSILEINVNKVNSVILGSNIQDELFYVKDSTWATVELPQGRYEIVDGRLSLEKKSYSRGKAVLVLKPLK